MRPAWGPWPKEPVVTCPEKMDPNKDELFALEDTLILDLAGASKSPDQHQAHPTLCLPTPLHLAWSPGN